MTQLANKNIFLTSTLFKAITNVTHLCKLFPEFLNNFFKKKHFKKMMRYKIYKESQGRMSERTVRWKSVMYVRGEHR